MPVIFPGFSHFNETGNGLNAIPRLAGRFYWQQINNLLKLHVDMLYVAMFDEVDEGTAIYKMVPHRNALPIGANMIALDQDGVEVSSDWYLRITGQAGALLKSKATPATDLNQVPGLSGRR
jgi:hypothetical protein